MSHAYMGWIFMALGAFAICGAAFDWGFFMNHRKARFLIWLFGRTGTRIFYGILGTMLAILGLLLVTGIIQSSK